jgi:trans-aconitate methyltransferase
VTDSRADTFDTLYRRSPDPWAYETSRYEREKYAATLRALPSARYHSGVEFGCSIGVLTAMLARRCDALVAVDVSAVALEAARTRPGNTAVRFSRCEIPAEWPDGRFDLLVFSEILYFLSASEVEETARRAVESLAAGGHMVLVNWLGPCETALDGDAAAEVFLRTVQAGGLSCATVCREREYRIDVVSA